MAKDIWHCGATNCPDSNTASERLFGDIDRRGVSTTGDGVAVGCRTVGVAGSLTGMSNPDAWSVDGSNSSVSSAISRRIWSRIEGRTSSTT